MSVSESFTRILKRFESARGSCDVTRRALTLGTRDTITGWRAKNYSETTIKMVIIPRGATSSAVAAGTYVRLDAVGLTATSVNEGDEIKTSKSVYYEVKTRREHCLTPDTVEYYENDLTKLSLHG